MSKPRSSKRARIFAPDGQPHVLGIDDGPFSKKQSAPVPIVAVLMQGAASVEGVAVTSFPVDGAGATEHLAQWIGGMRWHPMLHAIVVGGVTIAGLGLIDLERLSEEHKSYACRFSRSRGGEVRGRSAAIPRWAVR